ncbi:hypothetical protein K1719_029077 [Acacia pycnantha]|nr:hypothetical protein K1719_029045 [Acacia pycnantha]KAI9089784.1 hypothetical protein K1719_029077 [Acacia pycnantha]
MAASYAIQPLLASPVTRISNRSRVNQQLGFPATSKPTPRRNVSFRVRSMAEPDKKQASTKFSDVLAFSGPAPERINGRLAMIGFVAAMAVEGVSVESKSQSFMSSDAELWNGRFAMLGLVALAATEYLKGGTLV